MFDAADIIVLPGSPQRPGDGVSERVTGVVPGESIAVAGAAPVGNRNTSHVVEACAMAGDNVALAMSDGKLCHVSLSQMRDRAVESSPMEESRWPNWTSWPSRHGNVRSLHCDPAHDALVTLEEATTAAGNQAFLGRYHRKAGSADKERNRYDQETGKSSPASPWVGCSIPLATSQATVAVCASRGWAAVCTGSVVNLWAVAHQGSAQPQARGITPRLQQAPVGFEHALSVDLAGLVGPAGGTRTGGASHIALFGNLLAVATEHAVFLVRLSFHVKGEAASRCSNKQGTGFNPQAASTPRGGAQSPKAPSPQTHPPRSSRRDRAGTSLRAPSAKPEAKDVAPKLASRGGLSGKGKGLVGVGEGRRSSVSSELRKGGMKTKPERRDGIVERAVLEADDLVVCVLHPGGEEEGREKDSSTQAPALLRAFDDDWEDFRQTRGYLREPPELETTPLVTEPFPISLPVNGNSTVMDSVDGCDIVLARCVGPGEVVKELHLLPVPQTDDPCDSECEGNTSQDEGRRHRVDRRCRFVLLTSKSATVCLVCAARTCSVVTPSYPASARSPSPGKVSSSLPPSPPSTSYQGEGGGHPGCKGPPVGDRCSSSDLDPGAVDGGITAGCAAEDSQQLVVFLRRSYRFNNDVVLASITSAFLFVLTVEGIEVWTFPSDFPSVTDGQARKRLGEHRKGEMGTPVSSSSHPPARPCLLHVQKLEVDGVLPRSPATCMVPLEGAEPGLLIFPSTLAKQGASLAFLAQQYRRRLRSQVAADGPIANDNLGSRKPPAPKNPFSTWPGASANSQMGQDCWQRKFAAWQNGICALGKGRAAESTAPVALFLRLLSPTEAFRLISAAEASSARPLSATVSSMFLSAAEGLHSALTAQVTAAWRAAVGLAGRANTLSGNASSSSAVRQMRIEDILAGLANCWRLQRVAARCASLLGRLLLERAVSAAKQDPADENAATGLAYTRACSWLLASGEPVVESFACLQDAAARISLAGGEMERTVVAPSLISLDDDEGNPYSATAEISPPDLQDLLPRAMYEVYLLPSLGVRDTASRSPHVAFNDQAILAPDRKEQSLSLDDVLSGLVSYLHDEDMRRLSQRPWLRNEGDGTRRPTPLSTAVVYANRVPWSACPVTLSQALMALDEQDKVLADSTSGNISSSSGSSSASFSARKTPPGVSKRSKPARRARRDLLESTEHARGGSSLDIGNPAGDETTWSLTQEWVAVARAILMGYSEQTEPAGGHLAPPPGRGALAADSRILQLACERHPVLVAPMKVGPGPLARNLLMGGRVQPVVAALVNLTSSGGGVGRTGSGQASFGPQKAREMLQLREDCFSPTIDPLQALGVFGAPGRQIAARLDSLRRASLDLWGPYGSTSEARSDLFNDDAFEWSSDAIDNRTDRSETKTLAAAAREFLSRRCSASLITSDPSARHQERISQAFGAPEAWQASLACTRVLDRAILRYLISAHLDDLRALENSAARNPSSSTPTTGKGWGSGLVQTASNPRARNRRDREDCSWADAIAPLLSGQVPGARGAEEHVGAILRLVREITWRGSSADNGVSVGNGCIMSREEAEEVVTEAKRRLPVTDLAPASASTSVDYDDNGHIDDDTQPWGSGGEGTGTGRAPWPWGPRAVPASAVGAVLALAAALPPAGKLLAGLDVMLQVAHEVVSAAKAESAAAAGAAASGLAGKGVVRGAHPTRKDTRPDADGTAASVKEVSRAAERALLLYAGEYCGKDPDKWASVTEHVRSTSYLQRREGGGIDAADQQLVRALLRKCGEELGGKALVRALPESLDLMDCLEEVEQSLLRD